MYFWVMKKIIILTVIASLFVPTSIIVASPADTCVDVQFLFARGSGAEWYNSAEYHTFKSSILHETQESRFTFEVTDLDYPAVQTETLDVLLTAYISGGRAGAVADSVAIGVTNFLKYYFEISNACPNTHWVLFGFSQGTKVLANALKNLDIKNIVYIATFGDPHLYLPEGEGISPPACNNQNLSSYRVHVPNCRTDHGILGARQPYFPTRYLNKVGLWCNDADLICGSSKNLLSNSGHTKYSDSTGIPSAVNQAMRRIKYIMPETTVIMEEPAQIPADVAFVISGSASMQSQFLQYKSETIRLATAIVKNGGQIALLVYYDIYAVGFHNAVVLCDLGCTLGEFTLAINNIEFKHSVGDGVVNLPFAIAEATNNINWQPSRANSIVALSNTGYELRPLNRAVHDHAIGECWEKSVSVYVVATNQTYENQHEILTGVTNGGSYEVSEYEELTTHLLSPPVNTNTASKRTRNITNTATVAPPTNLEVISNGSSVRIVWQSSPEANYHLLIIDDTIMGILQKGVSEISIVDLDAKNLTSLS